MNKKIIISKEQLEQLYLIENLSKNETAKQLNIGLSTLSNLLKEYNIKKSNDLIQEKRKQTCINTYGVDNPSKSLEVINKIKKVNQDKYGANSFTSTKEGKQKIKNTKLEHFGNESYNNNEKSKLTKLERYGNDSYNNREKNKHTVKLRYNVDNVFQLQDVKNKILDSIVYVKGYNPLFRELMCDKNKSIEYLSGKKYTYYDLSKEFNVPYYSIQQWVTRLDLFDYISYEYKGTSHYEDELVEFLESLGVKSILRNDRGTIDSELDIYLPNEKVAIEFNGDYWHSSMFKKYNYHHNKSRECEYKGIRLIHIYQYQWDDSVKREILKSIIKNAVGKNTNKIYARKCEIRELNKNDVEEFSVLNSLHGHRNASVYIGLFYNNELVELMSFGNAFFSKDKSIDYECIRSITKVNTTVIGGMNKLFNYFINKYNPNKILYYVDYNTHNGNSMNKLGFVFESYSINGIINVSTCKEVDKLYGHVFNRKPEKHKEIMKLVKEGKVLTINDAGVKRYIWTK